LLKAFSLALGEFSSCLRSTRVRWKGRSKALTAACTLLLQHMVALSAHHGCTIAQLQHKGHHRNPCSGSVSERILACKGALSAPFRGLYGAVRCSAAAQRRGEKARSALSFCRSSLQSNFKIFGIICVQLDTILDKCGQKCSKNGACRVVARPPSSRLTGLDLQKSSSSS
jgi:hypothetical protein